MSWKIHLLQETAADHYGSHRGQHGGQSSKEKWFIMQFCYCTLLPGWNTMKKKSLAHEFHYNIVPEVFKLI